MVTFIDQHRDTYGVEPICAVLPIAPSTYFLHKTWQQAPATRSARRQRDDELRAAIQRVWDEHEQVYGPRKVWKQLRRDGIRVARCTVARLMRAMGLRGVSRRRAWTITTQSDRAAERPADLVDRQFTATRPNQLWVADFTYVATWRGFVYVAFVIDVFARRTVGCRQGRLISRSAASSTERSVLVRWPPSASRGSRVTLASTGTLTAAGVCSNQASEVALARWRGLAEIRSRGDSRPSAGTDRAHRPTAL